MSGGSGRAGICPTGLWCYLPEQVELTHDVCVCTCKCVYMDLHMQQLLNSFVDMCSQQVENHDMGDKVHTLRNAHSDLAGCFGQVKSD